MATTTPETTRVQTGKRLTGKAVGACAAVSAALMAGSLAFAGTASATPTALPDKFASTVTDDGWTLDLAATKLSANPVPNLATTAFTREGFVSAKVTGRFGPASAKSSFRRARKTLPLAICPTVTKTFSSSTGVISAPYGRNTRSLAGR